MSILKFYQTVMYRQCQPKLIFLQSPFLEVNEPQNDGGLKKQTALKKLACF